ncbi:MAG: zinc-ribbon domain-containing protein [Candidatus Korobacteraceae bacterium]|jgi:uncharacterized membrane protein
MAFCTVCGAHLNETAAFCPSCGTAVKRENAAAAGPATGVPVGDPPGGYQPDTAAPAISQNLAGMLCYIFFVGVIFLLVGPYNRNRFIRFHAFQSILFTIAWVVLHGVVAIPFFGWAIWPVMELAFLISWIVLLIKAYQGVMFKLPVIGEFAEQHA